MGSTIQVNGEPEPLTASTIAELLRGQEIELDSKGVAVALNGKVLPRRAWADTPLTDGDSVEIVKAFVGG
jgi:sulfur carrier protein